MTDNRKLFTIAILPIIVIGIGFFWAFVKVNSASEEIKEYILPLKINGRIIERQIDLKDHATKYVILKARNGKTILYDSYWPFIYDHSNVGDSIYKDSGSIGLYIIDKNNRRTEIRYNPSSLYFHKKDWLKKLKK